MAPLLSLLLSTGPQIIRLFGKNKGGSTEKATEVIAEVLENTRGFDTKSSEAALTNAIEQLDPAALSSIKVGLEEIAAEREKNRLDHDLGMHQAQQKTLQSTDIKGIRPQIANRHSWFTAAYLIVFEAAHVAGHGSGANWEVATLLAAPTLAWFGFRTWDKFSKTGAS